MVGRWRAGEEGSFSCARSLRAYISPVVNAVSERQSRRSGPASVLVRVRILLCARTPFRPTLRALGRIFSRFSRASEFFLTDKKKNAVFVTILLSFFTLAQGTIIHHPRFSPPRGGRIVNALFRKQIFPPPFFPRLE